MSFWDEKNSYSRFKGADWISVSEEVEKGLISNLSKLLGRSPYWKKYLYVIMSGSTLMYAFDEDDLDQPVKVYQLANYSIEILGKTSGRDHVVQLTRKINGNTTELAFWSKRDLDKWYRRVTSKLTSAYSSITDK